MIGAIAGDIIGSVFEQANVKTTEFALFVRGSTFTDDTVMTLALADALLHERDIAPTFQSFYYRYPWAGYGPMFSNWARSDALKPYGSFGNGSAMRVSPAAWACHTEAEVLEIAAKSAAVSHNHPEGIKGAEAIALATFLARTDKDKDAVLDAVVARCGYDLGFTLDEIRADYHFDATCQGSVPQALVAFREGSDFESTVRLAISIGGDSDTIACMAGAVAEAFYGGVPAFIVEQVRLRLDERLNGVLALFEDRFMAEGRPGQ